MKEAELYYTPPSDEIFEEVKQAAIDLWSTLGQTDDYREEKIGRIKNLCNIQDNLMYIVAMFDYHNQKKLAVTISAEASLEVRIRMIDGGMPDYLIVF